MLVPLNHPYLVGFSIINHPFWVQETPICYCLVGGFEHDWIIFYSAGNVIIPTDDFSIIFLGSSLHELIAAGLVGIRPRRELEKKEKLLR